MSELYISFNGDDVGAGIGEAIASDDHDSLDNLSSSISEGHGGLKEWAEQLGGKVVVSSGDETIVQVPENAVEEIEHIKQAYESDAGHTLTIGMGDSMSEASKALIYGKMNGKNSIVHYNEEVENFVQSQGVGDEEIAGGEQEETVDEVDSGLEGEEGEPFDEEEMEEISDGPEDFEGEEESVGEMEDGDEFSEEDAQQEEEAFAEEEEAALEEDMEGGLGPEGEPEGYDDEIEGEEAGDNVEEEIPEEDMEEGDASDMMGDMIAANMGGEEEEEIPEEEGMEEGMDPGMEGVEDEYDEIPEEEIHGEEGGEEMPPEEGMEEDGDNEALKQEIFTTLQTFKQHKDMIEQLQEANPELYQANISLLQNMIQMARMLGFEGMEGDPMAGGAEEEIPELQDHEIAGGGEMPPEGGEMPPEAGMEEGMEAPQADTNPDGEQDFGTIPEKPGVKKSEMVKSEGPNVKGNIHFRKKGMNIHAYHKGGEHKAEFGYSGSGHTHKEIHDTVKHYRQNIEHPNHLEDHGFNKISVKDHSKKLKKSELILTVQKAKAFVNLVKATKDWNDLQKWSMLEQEHEEQAKQMSDKQKTKQNVKFDKPVGIDKPKKEPKKEVKKAFGDAAAAGEAQIDEKAKQAAKEKFDKEKGKQKAKI